MFRKRVHDLNFGKKLAFLSIFGQNSTFLTFFKKHLHIFLIFFRNSNEGKHILFDYVVKLNADSEFLVHFSVGLHFGLF